MVLSQTQQEAVLDALAGGERVADVADAIGCSTAALYRFKRATPAFARGWDEAMVASCDVEMDHIREMAVDKNLDGTRARAREVSFKILAWYVARRAPAKYGDRVEVNMRGQLDMGAILLAADERLLRLTARRAPLRLPDVDSQFTGAGSSVVSDRR